MNSNFFSNAITNILMCAIFLPACSSKNISAPTPVVSSLHSYYVSAAGSDANAGTIDAPLRSINTALSKIVPGDTVIVRDGTYYEKISFTKSGRQDKWITLK